MLLPDAIETAREWLQAVNDGKYRTVTIEAKPGNPEPHVAVIKTEREQ